MPVPLASDGPSGDAAAASGDPSSKKPTQKQRYLSAAVPPQGSGNNSGSDVPPGNPPADPPGDNDGDLPGGKRLATLRIRQRQVLLGLVQGMSEKEVAVELGISPNTVHAHVKELHRHFDVSSRGELLSLFVDRRVIENLRATADNAS
ncbi:MAG: LuxR C-terminal-related transcriptional regulator [Planctomycetota bacterium]